MRQWQLQCLPIMVGRVSERNNAKQNQEAQSACAESGGDSRSFWLCLYDVFQVLIDSLVCYFRKEEETISQRYGLEVSAKHAVHGE